MGLIPAVLTPRRRCRGYRDPCGTRSESSTTNRCNADVRGSVSRRHAQAPTFLSSRHYVHFQNGCNGRRRAVFDVPGPRAFLAECRYWIVECERGPASFQRLYHYGNHVALVIVAIMNALS